MVRPFSAWRTASLLLTYNQSIYDYLVAKANLDLVMGVEDVINVEEKK